MTDPTQPSPQQTAPTCYRHPDVPTGIVCTRCGRPICGACMVDAAVGFQCPECVREGMAQTRQAQLPYGGARLADPRLTSIVLIALNVIVFGAAFLVRGLDSVLALTPAGTCMSVADPGSYYPGQPLEACRQMADGHWAAGVATGQWWQPLTSAFTHNMPWHLAVNMMSLWFLGPNLERALGRARFLAVYLIAALGGSAAVMWLAEPDSSSLGASGAIFGLLGALALLIWKHRGNLQQLLIVLVVNLGISFMPGISWQGHLGGFVAGLAATAVIVFAPRGRRTTVQWPALALLAALVVGLIVVRALQLA